MVRCTVDFAHTRQFDILGGAGVIAGETIFIFIFGVEIEVLISLSCCHTETWRLCGEAVVGKEEKMISLLT